MATSFWVELSEAGAIRLSRKEAADREYKNAYEGAIGGDVASKIYDLASQTLTNFHFPKRDTGSCDGTNIELSLIFHQRAMTVEFIALDAPQSAGRSVEMIFKILNSKLPEGSRIW